MTTESTDDAPVVSIDLARGKRRECGGWERKLLRTKDNSFRKALTNVNVALGYHPDMRGRLRWNELACVVEKAKAPPWGREGEWTDADDAEAIMWMERAGLPSFSPAMVRQAAESVARDHAYHPVRDWLASLQWDGTVRLPSWLGTYFGATNPEAYLADVGTWWLVSAVARAFRPGCQVDHVIVLEGDQGMGKNEAIQRLVGPEYLDQMSESLGQKDALMKLRGKWVLTLDELSSLKRTDIEKVKAFITDRIDRYRSPYGRRMESHPRQCVFIGTTNSSEWMADATGGRRWWPVRVTSLDFDGLSRDRDQLWAEAVARLESNEKWWPSTAEERERCADAVDEVVQVDPWESKIETYLAARDQVEMADLLGSALGKEPKDWTRYDETRCGYVMKRLGWKRKRVTTSAGRIYLYERPCAGGAS